MKKRTAALFLALSLLGGAAQADMLSVPGLGRFPFESLHVTDGEGTAVEAMLRRHMETAEPKETKRTALLRFLTMPDGMRLRNESGLSAVSGLHVYQLVKEDSHGMYTMMVFVFSGDRETLFRRSDKKAADFWARAFEEEETKRAKMSPDKQYVFLKDFQRAALSVMEGKPGEAPRFRILDASAWKPYHNGDGTVRWQQSVKIALEREDGFVMPSWYESVLYRTKAGRYVFLLFLGSHQSAVETEEEILHALYRVERSEK